MKRWIRLLIVWIAAAGCLLFLIILFIPIPIQDMQTMRAKAAMKQAYQIHQALFAYAQAHDQAMPDGKSTNEVFRKLFQEGLLDDENLFFIKAQNGGGKSPDGDIGTQDDGFAKALEPGECCFYYIRGGVTDRDDSARPILFTRVGGRDGKVFTISIRVGGQARVEDPRVEDWFNKEYLKSKYGIDPSDILAPEGPIPGPWELPLPPGPKVSPSVWVAGSMGGLAVLLAIYLKFIRKHPPIPIESVPGA